jgi:SET domain-containing protein
MGKARRRPSVPGADNVVVRGSRVHGRGLFARRAMPAGARVIEYVGEKITKAESERRTLAQWDAGRVYTFELNKRYDVDGAPLWNRARYANHGCDPNCETEVVRGHIWLVAIRDIAEGAEITYDYNFPVDEDLVPCRCGARTCRGYIVGEDQLAKLRRALRTKRGHR